MEQAVVLFVHHENDATTRLHRELLRQHNDFPVISLFCDDGRGGTPLDDAVCLQKTFQSGSNWHNVDWICRQWFNSPDRIDARRYIQLDWDCHVNIPLEQWYGSLWSHDVVGSSVKNENSKWHWMKKQRRLLPADLQPFATGIVPFNGTLLSYKAMETYARTPIPEGINPELRLPTVLAAQGFKISAMPADKAKKNIFLPHGQSLPVVGQGFFHPVKDIQLTRETPNSNRGRIVATMLAGNNEATVEEAILSVRDWVDSFLLIDTGITDQTVEIAKRLLGEKLVVDSFPWCNDFSRARNFALRRASELRAEWALTIDTDESLSFDGFEDVSDLKSQLSVDDVTVWTVQANTMKYAKERFIRMPTSLSWVDQTHEQLVGGSARQRRMLSSCRFSEHPKTPDQMLHKLKRDLPILLHKTIQAPEHPRSWFYLGQTCSGLKQYKEAAEAYQRSAELESRKSPKAWAYFCLATALIRQQRYSQAIVATQKAMAIRPDRPDLLWQASFICYQLERFHDAIAYAVQAVAHGNSDGSSALSGWDQQDPKGWYEGPFDVLRYSWRALGNPDKAQQFSQQWERARQLRLSHENGASRTAIQAEAAGRLPSKMLNNRPVTLSEIKDSYQLAEGWFLSSIKSKGLFQYLYDSHVDEYSSKNNAIRQLMASRLLAELATENVSLHEAHVKNTNFIFENWAREHEGFHYISLYDKSKLGANAMMLRTLVASPFYGQCRSEAARFKDSILRCIKSDGSMIPFLFPPKYDYDADYMLTFYSGEALLALLEYYVREQDAELLATVKHVQDHYLEKYVTNLEQNYYPAYVPWHTMSLNLLYKLTKEKKYADAIFVLNDKLLELLDRTNHVGRFYNPETPQFGTPHGSSDGVYTEGLVYALEIAQRLQDQDRIVSYQSALGIAFGHLLTLQYTPANSTHLPAPQRAIGGFRIRRTAADAAFSRREGSNIRIDTVQHIMDAMRKYLTLGKPTSGNSAYGVGKYQDLVFVNRND